MKAAEVFYRLRVMPRPEPDSIEARLDGVVAPWVLGFALVLAGLSGAVAVLTLR